MITAARRKGGESEESHGAAPAAAGDSITALRLNPQLHTFPRGEYDEFGAQIPDAASATFNDLIDDTVGMGWVMVENRQLLHAGLDRPIHRRLATGMAPAFFGPVLGVGVLAIGDEQIGVPREFHQC